MRATFDPRRASIHPVAALQRGGFLALRVADAATVVQRLRTRGVHSDARGDLLRLGPAPYVSEGQLRDAAEALREVICAP